VGASTWISSAAKLEELKRKTDTASASEQKTCVRTGMASWGDVEEPICFIVSEADPRRFCGLFNPSGRKSEFYAKLRKNLLDGTDEQTKAGFLSLDDYSAPSVSQLTAAVTFLASQTANVIHCGSGCGRTGLIMIVAVGSKITEDTFEKWLHSAVDIVMNKYVCDAGEFADNSRNAQEVLCEKNLKALHGYWKQLTGQPGDLAGAEQMIKEIVDKVDQCMKTHTDKPQAVCGNGN